MTDQKFVSFLYDILQHLEFVVESTGEDFVLSKVVEMDDGKVRVVLRETK